MHIIYDIKNNIASELAGFGFSQLKLTAQPVNCAKQFLVVVGAQLQCIYYLVLYTDLKAAEGN